MMLSGANPCKWNPARAMCAIALSSDCGRAHRVVLQRLLLPPLGEKGPAKKVRVCNACLRNSEVRRCLPSTPFALRRRGDGTAVPFVAASLALVVSLLSRRAPVFCAAQGVSISDQTDDCTCTRVTGRAYADVLVSRRRSHCRGCYSTAHAPDSQTPDRRGARPLH